ncbi:MAG: hypothetical protein J7K84_06305, partial [Deltaproteobacteria bacterium]|nr:hypothetical protein [Deltaproteobacteria bacterium]
VETRHALSLQPACATICIDGIITINIYFIFKISKIFYWVIIKNYQILSPQYQILLNSNFLTTLIYTTSPDGDRYQIKIKHKYKHLQINPIPGKKVAHPLQYPFLIENKNF